jgi:hypothetical protein
MLKTLRDQPDLAKDPHEKIPPIECTVRRDDFVALQRHGATVKEEAVSPIGIFSIEKGGSFYAGWSTNATRVSAPKNDAWSVIAPAIRRVGPNFLLRGYDVVAYRRARPPYR